MSKKFSSLIVATVSSLLLNSASFGGLDCNSCHENDPTGSKGKAAAFHYTVSKPNSDEARWWNDFETSKERDITRYVEDLASKDAKAATWFLLTGGKHGFSSRQATDQETALLLSAMKKVAQFFGNSNDRMQGLQEWATAKASVEAGHLHLQMLYKEVNKLKEDNKSLNFEVASLKTRLAVSETKQQETEKRLSATEKEHAETKVRLSASERKQQEINREHEETKTRLSASETKQQELMDQLGQERNARKKELEDLKQLLEDKHTNDMASMQEAFNKTLESSLRFSKEHYTKNPLPRTQQFYVNEINKLQESKKKTKNKLEKIIKTTEDLQKEREELFKEFRGTMKEERSAFREAIEAIKLMLEKK